MSYYLSAPKTIIAIIPFFVIEDGYSHESKHKRSLTNDEAEMLLSDVRLYLDDLDVYENIEGGIGSIETSINHMDYTLLITTQLEHIEDAKDVAEAWFGILDYEGQRYGGIPVATGGDVLVALDPNSYIHEEEEQVDIIRE